MEVVQILLLLVLNVLKDTISMLTKNVSKLVKKDSLETLILKPVNNVILHV